MIRLVATRLTAAPLSPDRPVRPVLPSAPGAPANPGRPGAPSTPCVCVCEWCVCEGVGWWCTNHSLCGGGYIVCVYASILREISEFSLVSYNL